jgi:hypothetical protein
LEELIAFAHKYADVPPFWESLMAHYAMFSWVYDRFTALPYLRFQGEPGTGKTRCLQIVGNLSYKAIVAAGASSSASIFRLIDIYHGTLLFDEADFKDSELWADIVKILNTGYARGFPILRCDGDTHEPRAFNVFGPKVLSTRRVFGDQALETRCITLNTTETKPRASVPRQLPPEFYPEARNLRNKLLQWRFDNYWLVQADESKLMALEPRLTQIGTPLGSIAKFRDEVW